jgi:hypothetical protein
MYMYVEMDFVGILLVSLVVLSPHANEETILVVRSNP